MFVVCSFIFIARYVKRGGERSNLKVKRIEGNIMGFLRRRWERCFFFFSFFDLRLAVAGVEGMNHGWSWGERERMVAKMKNWKREGEVDGVVICESEDTWEKNEKFLINIVAELFLKEFSLSTIYAFNWYCN
jgi:hypothetical protein